MVSTRAARAIIPRCGSTGGRSRLDRPIDAHRFDCERFLRESRPGASFLPTALAGPKHWLVGSAGALPSLARAAA